MEEIRSITETSPGGGRAPQDLQEFDELDAILNKRRVAKINRDRYEIFEELLTILSYHGTWVSTTNLIYGAMLSFSQFEDLIKFMEETGLIEKSPERPKRWRITDKGKLALAKFIELNDMVDLGREEPSYQRMKEMQTSFMTNSLK